MITLTTVGISLKTPFDDELAVMLANSWLKSHNLPDFDAVPDDVLMAGALVAQAISDGEMYQGRQEGLVVSKSSKAGDVSVSKTYADGVDGRAMGRREMIALALIQPYIKRWVGFNVSVGRV